MIERLYWHFAAIDNQGRPIMRDGTLIEIGKRYEIAETVVLCKRGYHGSLLATDALHYTPGPWVSRRPLEGVIDGDDKSVGRAFVQQRGVDATDILRDFARWCALRVIHLWDAPEVVRRYLETGDESLRPAAWEAACDAARAAAWEAACDAARAAACDAARAAAWEAAWEAAWDSERDAQNEKLESMILAALQIVQEDNNDEDSHE